MSSESIRVVVTYRVCQHWRSHIFAKLNAMPNLNLSVFHGSSIPGTKYVNGEDLRGFEHREHFTISVPGAKKWVAHPFIWWSLIRHRPDVIVSEGGSNFLTNFFVLAYAKVFRRPIVWWTLGELRGDERGGFFRGFYRRLVRFQERCSDVYLGYSAVALDYFRKMGYPAEDCFIAVNCVDTNRVLANIEERKDEAMQLRSSLNLTDKKVILFVGAFTVHKRIDRLIRAFAQIKSDLPDAILMIVGDGNIAEELRELAVTEGVADRTIFTGAVIENVSDYYQLGDVFVLPGLGGLAISEAMTHGMPVICTVADGCEVDLIDNGTTGYRLFSDDDTKVEPFLAEKLVALLSDEQQLNEISRNAREHIETTHNVNTYIQKIVDSVEHAHQKRLSRSR
ncbi:MAG: glycosyltransferase family 4 protein [Planctomycetota bacterium]